LLGCIIWCERGVSSNPQPAYIWQIVSASLTARTRIPHMKYFLLTAGDCYYPQGGTEDWIGCFDTYQDALSQVKEVQHYETITKGKKKGEQRKTFQEYFINGTKYDWYCIIDLIDWIRP
jgi:hypothetical protein